MWVRQKIGRTAGAIVEMQYEAAQAAIAAGNVGEVTDAELQEAGFPTQAAVFDVPADKLLGEYRIEPSPSGQGFDIYEPGGVQINEMPIHNQAAARDEAHRHARAARGLAPLDDGSTSGDGKTAGAGGEPSKAGAAGEADYSAMTKAELESAANDRGVDLSGAGTKADQIALLQRADKVNAAVGAGEYEALTRPELEKLAVERSVDISHARSKADVVAALKK